MHHWRETEGNMSSRSVELSQNLASNRNCKTSPVWASTCTSQAWPISCHSDLLGVASAPRIRACLAARTKRDPKKTGKTKIEYDSITVYIMHILIPKERTTNMHWKNNWKQTRLRYECFFNLGKQTFNLPHVSPLQPNHTPDGNIYVYGNVSPPSSKNNHDLKSAGLAGVSSEMGLDEGLLVCTLLLLI